MCPVFASSVLFLSRSANQLWVGTQPLGVGTQPSLLGVELLSIRDSDKPIFDEILLSCYHLSLNQTMLCRVGHSNFL